MEEEDGEEEAHRDLPNFRYMSDARYFVVVGVGFVSCLLSIAGSSAISHLILSKKKYTTSLFHRIMLGLSTADLVCTSATLLQPILLPSFTELPLAQGNVRTCEAVGFFFQFFAASALYSSILSFYFLLTIRYDWREEKASRILEPWIHLIPWLFAIAISSAGVALNAFNPSLLMGVCLFENFPSACDENSNFDCRARPSSLTRLVWTYNAFAFFSAISGVANTWMVYAVVRRNARRSRRYDFPGAMSEAKQKQTKAVARQAVCYTLAFLNSFLVALFGTMVNFIFNSSLQDAYNLNDEPLVFLAVFLLYTFYPLQGFFNMIIYVRPTLLRWKDANPERSWWWSFRQVLSGRPAPTTASRRPRPAPAIAAPPREEEPTEEGESGRTG